MVHPRVLARLVALLLIVPYLVAIGAGATEDEVDDGVSESIYLAEEIPATTRDTTGWPTLSLGDDMVAAISVAPTRLFEVDRTTLYLSSNGFVSVENNGSGCCSGQPLPQEDHVNGLIAGVWTDLDPRDCGRIAYSVGPNGTIISFEDVCYYGNYNQTDPTAASFRIEISTDGTLQVHLLRIDGGRTATTGVESPDGLAGLELRHGSEALAAPIAWQLVPTGLEHHLYIEESIDPQPVNITGWATLPLVDDDVQTVAIPATSFYNLNVTQMHVSSNGFVALGAETPDGCCVGGDIPAADGIDSIIAPLWADLDPKRCGTVAYNLTDGVKVAFVGVPYYGSHCDEGGATVTFWLSIDAAGHVEIHLLEAAGGVLATTGIESWGGTVGNLTRQSADALDTARAWRYTHVVLEPPAPEPIPEPEPEPWPDGYNVTHTFEGRVGCPVAYGPVQTTDFCSDEDTATQSVFPFPVQIGATSMTLRIETEPGPLGEAVLCGIVAHFGDACSDEGTVEIWTADEGEALVGNRTTEVDVRVQRDGGVAYDQPVTIQVEVAYWGGEGTIGG